MDTPRSIAFAIEKAKHKAALDLQKEFHKGKDGYTPKKGVDYFTDADILGIKAAVLAMIPQPKDGISPEVDYEMILAYCFEKIAEHIQALPPAPPGKDGKDAVVNIEELVVKVLKAIPKQKDKKLVIDKESILKLIDERVSRIPPQQVRIGGSVASLRALTDVNLDGLTQDEHGNYILGGGASTAAGVSFDPYLSVTSNDVQGALEEIIDDITALSVGAGITRTIVVTSGNVTAGATASRDYVYLVAGLHTVTLPTAVGNTNRYTIKNNHSANTTVGTTSSQTIDGTTTISLAPQSSVDIISNGTNWCIV